MSNFMNKMLNFVGFDTEDGIEEDYYMEEKEPVKADYDDAWDRFSSRRSSRVVKLHDSGSQQMRVMVFRPRDFEEARDITNHLKERRSSIINLESVEKEVARRIVDFLSGAVYALDGDMQKISNGIFFVAPQNVEIQGEEITDVRGGFPWNN